MKQVAICLGLLALAYTAAAFSCKSCMYMTTDNEQVNNILNSAMQAVDSEQMSYSSNCKDSASDSGIATMECPADSCMAAKIEATVSNQENSATMEMYLRTCGDKDEKPGCKSMSEYEDKIKQSMGAAASMMEDFHGTACLCNTTNCNVQASNALSAAVLPSSEISLIVSLMGTLLLVFHI